MFGNLTGWHLVAVLVVVLVLFGAPKLPGLARSLGQSMRIFRSEVKTMKDESAADAEPADDETEDEPPAKAKKTPSKGGSAGSKP
ncbi:sec-independent protein translocase protein TatA [Microbacteriaceae bacterium SG_E_30_P1]|uniref:Sec-independent protein translocase protein TatA n=1 Tax=Antiquaquibacter oligotrophicus TaxID=2880260 RepID=A0ABT6KN45_9MICO|nr:Sec-independent protein translocase subunit TatA [Antiquaquibacter oligotrophicus]MDH6180863.1 sec-independent protein translocase protein TatA [Antiquaquibacter oligotrophicus]UDF13424.1 Sec-independent protein translocase subunit TatA [Antiquaquibacter oligotrophicus]